MKKARIILFLFTVLSFNLSGQEQPSELDIELEVYLTGMSNTADIQFWGETMFVVDQDGIIEMVQEDIVLDDPFLSITSLVQFSGERGLLGLAFDPGFDTNNTFYVNYINNSGNTVIAAYQTLEDSLMGDPLSANILLTMTQPYSNHNGGQIQFGPDGYLYIGMGDGGSGGDPDDRSQDPLEYMGKMLRIDVSADTYSIPDDNPFVDNADYLGEIWAIGVRNPWRFSFDKETGDLWIADVGQNQYEEIDFQPFDSEGGENWGWRCYEGLHPYNTSGCGPASDYDDPIFEYSHSGGHCSVTGGYVYRGDDSDLLNGIYLGIDYCSGYLFGLRRMESGELEEYDWGNYGFGFSTFGEDLNGDLYVAKQSGTIYKIVDPCHTQTPGIQEGVMVVYAEEGFADYDWYFNDEFLLDSNSDSLLAQGNGEYYYIVENENGCFVKSEVIYIAFTSIEEQLLKESKIFPNPFTSSFSLGSQDLNLERVNLYSIDGKLIFKQDVFGEGNTFTFDQLEKGSYLFEVIDKNGNRNTQLIIKE